MKRWEAVELLEVNDWQPVVTLTEYNDARLRELQEIAHQAQHPEAYSNGLLCPECGGHLYDTNKQTEGHPVKILVRCHGTYGNRRQCNFRGERHERART